MKEALQGIPNDAYNSYHLDLINAVDRFLHGISLLESGNEDLGTQRIREARDDLILISKEFEDLLDDQ